MFSERVASIALTAVVGLVLLAMGLGAQDFLRYSRHFPFTFGLIGAGLAAVIIFRDLVLAKPPVPQELTDGETVDRKSPLLIFAWFGLYFGLVPVLGFPTATGVFTIAFLRAFARASWLVSIIYAAVAVGFIFFMGYMLNMEWPTGFVSRAITTLAG